MFGNKGREFAQISDDLQILSTKVIDQFALTETLLVSGKESALYEKMKENDKNISCLKAGLFEKIPKMTMLFSPKAADLRKIVAHHDVTLLMAEINDLLLDIVSSLKEINISEEDYADFKPTMEKMLHSLKESTHAAIYFFINENESGSLEILKKDIDIQQFSTEITENIVASFQEIPLSGQQVFNIISLNKITYIFHKIKNCILNVTKTTIYAINGTNIRHQLPQS